ncbi:pheromone-processing carboxypeptidase KEX1 [Macrolepiota fuliginosa MF-IS2]|uniref:Pheromone-processing carboxypeptidase KEX1 n=1 Tax=Macrolepiota fuliginosa MF-IS2 TaxID=1400762 RepID=A0A9P6C6B4_9AGAR|nr:pheromone-processing carboxypeptidase KEX1 [Macrolepiota fuliginosa MF-IS2]
MLPLLALFLLPFLRHALAAPSDTPTAASFYVDSIPGIQQDPDHPLTIYAGHLSSEYNVTRVQQTDEVIPHLFFVLIKNRRTADRERIAFWFNGGPGCSSFDGLMMEVGPWRTDGKGGFRVQEGGWEEYTTMVFLDQPAGTGFSYTSTDRYVHFMDEAQKQFITFLQHFYDVFPEYRRMDVSTRPAERSFSPLNFSPPTQTYLAGESFAGQWIPYYADAVLHSNLNIPLKGIAIGNGWIDPKKHYQSYLDYSVKVGILEENSAPWKEAKKATDACTEAIEKAGDAMAIDECQGLLLDVTKVREKTVKDKMMCINIYDVRYDDENPACGMNWPPEIHDITSYLGRQDVVSALHATARPGGWVECRGDVHRAFQEAKMKSSFTILPQVLEKIPVLIFAGDQDLICNYVGLEAMIKDLTWNGGTGLGTVKTQSWNVNAAPAGTWVESRNLTYVKIFNASHMAPYDVPHVAHDMMLRFMNVNFSAIIDGSAKIPSSIGTQAKPVLVEEQDAKPTTGVPPAKTPEQDKAMWEAYYNAGSAALVLLLVFLAIGIFIWCRVRRRRVQLPSNGPNGDDEESIPLNSSIGNGHGRRGSDDESGDAMRSRKGKEKAVVFDVGSDEDDDGYRSRS